MSLGLSGGGEIDEGPWASVCSPAFSWASSPREDTENESETPAPTPRVKQASVGPKAIRSLASRSGCLTLVAQSSSDVFLENRDQMRTYWILRPTVCFCGHRVPEGVESLGSGGVMNF